MGVESVTSWVTVRRYDQLGKWWNNCSENFVEYIVVNFYARNTVSLWKVWCSFYAMIVARHFISMYFILSNMDKFSVLHCSFQVSVVPSMENEVIRGETFENVLQN